MSIDERIHLSQAIQRLDIELLLYDLTHDNPEEQLFVQSIRKRIPYDPSNIDSFFAQSVLDGELSRVKQLYENTNLKIDFVDLFEKLITLIEDGSPNSAKLIHVADYFHQTSELYRSYLLFRLSNQMLRLSIEFENTSGVSTGKITVNRLALMYLNDRKEAFALFLRHGFSPLGCHAYFGNIGFNALQMILLASTSGPDVIPYIDLLFEYGANIHTPKIVLPTTYYIINLHNQSQSSACDIFRHLKKGSPSKIKFTAKSTVENLSSAQKKLIEVLSDYMNILDFAIHLKHPQSERIVENLAERCDLKTRMIELCNILKQDSVKISIIPTRQGGCFFYKSEAEHLKKCKFLEPLRKQEDDIIVMELLPSAIEQLQSMSSLGFFQSQCDKFSVVTHNKTMSIHLCPNPEYSIDQTHRILAIAQSIHDISKKTFKALSMEMQREHVDSLRRLAIAAQLKGDLVQTSAYYLGSIIAISWIQPLLLRDYKILFAILFQYGSVIEKSVKLIKTNTHVLEDITINTTHLFSHLHDAIKIELMSTKIMGVAIAEDSKAELTK